MKKDGLRFFLFHSSLRLSMAISIIYTYRYTCIYLYLLFHVDSRRVLYRHTLYTSTTTTSVIPVYLYNHVLIVSALCALIFQSPTTTNRTAERCRPQPDGSWPSLKVECKHTHVYTFLFFFFFFFFFLIVLCCVVRSPMQRS